MNPVRSSPQSNILKFKQLLYSVKLFPKKTFGLFWKIIHRRTSNGVNYYQFFYKFYQKAGQKMAQDCSGFIENNAKILDLGCGSGIITQVFEKRFQADIIGADISDKRIAKIPFRLIDSPELPFPNESFNSVLLFYVLHHTQNPVSILKEAKRVAKDKIIIYEDLPEGFFSKIYCYFHNFTFNKFFQKRQAGNNFKKTPEWEKVFQDLGLKTIWQKNVSSFGLPIKKKMFVLEKIR